MRKIATIAIVAAGRTRLTLPWIIAALLSGLPATLGHAGSLADAALDKVRFYDSFLTYTDGLVLSTTKASATTPQNRDECRAKCETDKACQSFVWNTIDNACEMKSGTNLVPAFVDYFNSGVKAPYGSGALTAQFDVRNYTYSGGTVLKSTPMPNVDPMDYGPCRDACAADSACNSFVWNNIDKVCESKSGQSFVNGTVDYFFAGIKRSYTDLPNLWISYQCYVLPSSNNAKCRYELAADDKDIADIQNITLDTGEAVIWNLNSDIGFLKSQKSLADSVSAQTLTMAWDISVPPRRIKEVWAEVETTRKGKPVVFTVPMREGVSYSVQKPDAADLARPNPICQSNLGWTPAARTDASISQRLDIVRSADSFYWHMFVNFGGDNGGYAGLQRIGGSVSRLVFSVWGTKTFTNIANGVACTASDQQEGLQPGVSCLLDGSFGAAEGAHTLKMTQAYDDTDHKVWITGNVDGTDIAKVALDPKPGETLISFSHQYSANEYFGPPPTAQTVVTWDPPSTSTDVRKKTALYNYDCSLADN